MNQALDPLEFETAAVGSGWLADNDRVLQLGLAWVRARLRGLAAAPASEAEPSDDGAKALRLTYETARDAMVADGRPGALDLLASTFGLSGFDLDVLLLAWAPQVDAGLAALYEQAHGRQGLGQATRHLIETLLCPTPAARVQARIGLAADGALRRNALILVESPDALSPIVLDERMMGFVQGLGGWDQRLRGLLHRLSRAPTPDRVALKSAGLVERIAASGQPAAQIVGPRRSGRRAAAWIVAAHFGLTPTEIEVRALPAAGPERRALLALMIRETALSRLCLVVDASPETLGPDDPAASLAVLVAREAATEAMAVTLVLSEDPVVGLGGLPMLRLAPLTREERLAGWTEALAAHAIAPEIIESVVDHFPFGLSQMAEVADSLATGEVPDRQALWAACRERATGRLEGLAQRIEARRGWPDLVLPPSVLADLRAVADQVGQRGTVYGRWGYDALLPRGRGVSALFSGPSGVGKTLAAEVIARELGLDLYCVDLATVVSKYIGETEKNLKRIFDAAEEAGAVLFVDEADALFGKRTEVKDSHDRHANIEVSYLLQRIEQYDGLAILATNLRNNIDFGFLRRLRYLIDFPFPDYAGRQMLWRKAFPPQAPLHDIDFERLAGLEIAGGNIIVIATNAAFLAAAEQTSIGMRHVEQAAHAEFRKLDRLYDLAPFRGATS
ncbi:MAG: ATP-binding protein [Phenylobacterium sp.]